MDSVTRRALALLRKIKSVTFATVANGAPAARIIDVMWVDDDGLYFVTGRGKSFHRELEASGRVAVSGMTPECVAVRIVGRVRETGDPAVARAILEHNPVLTTLYPHGKHDILDVFQLFRGRGEIFDLSAGPPTRERFAFGGEKVAPPGLRITDACTGCGVCKDSCPVDVISEGNPYRIEGVRCLGCGRCAEMCPVAAIVPAEGL